MKVGRTVFENVNVDAIVSVFINKPQPFLRILDPVGKEIRLKRVIRKNDLKPPYAYDWLFSDYVELLAKIESNCARLSKYGVCENACATSDAYKLQEYIEEEPKDVRQNEYLRIVITPAIKHVNFMQHKQPSDD